MERILKNLRVDSSTGPDAVAARVLQKRAREIAIPLAKLARRIVLCHRWPAGWVLHWEVAVN